MRTAFICDYLASPDLRREINDGLQVVEHWDSGNGVISYGKDGDLAGPDREHQQVSMLALHLLQSALVHLNTLLVQRVLEQPDWAGRLTDEDRRGLGLPVVTEQERTLSRQRPGGSAAEGVQRGAAGSLPRS